VNVFTKIFRSKETAPGELPSRKPFQPLGEEYWSAILGKKEKGILREILSAWVDREVSRRLTNIREMVLDPNKGSDVKIERYSFGIHTTVMLGVVGAPLNLTGQPDVNIRPQRVIMNAPSPGFAIIEEIRVANVAVTVGLQEDAFNYSALAQNSHLDMPTLSPANRVAVIGEMTGRVPEGFGFKNPTGPGWVDEETEQVAAAMAASKVVPEGEIEEFLEQQKQKQKYRKRSLGESYLFTCSFQGPATIVA
jgi:hypothetical protein